MLNAKKSLSKINYSFAECLATLRDKVIFRGQTFKTYSQISR